MKKIILLFLVNMTFSLFYSQTFRGGFPAFKQRGAPASTIQYYCVDNGSGCSGRTIYNNANLGTSLLGKHTLRLMGGEAYVSRCSTETITSVTMNYRAFKVGTTPGAFTALSYERISGSANGCGGQNEIWRKIESGDGIAISAGPPNSVVDSPGTYTLEIYYEMATGSGTAILNNAGSNYKANFTIVDHSTWSGTAWDNGEPGSQTNAFINGNLNINSVFATNDMTINTGQTVTVASGYSLKSYGNVVNNGTIIVENNATFLQENGDTYSGSGNAIVRRNASLKRGDFNFWSSPVSGQNLFAFSPGTPTTSFYLYDEATDLYIRTGLNATSTFQQGIGYAIRGKNSYSTTVPTNETFTFTGVPNSGLINITLKKSAGVDKGYNLIGNPYPSNISFGSLFNYGNNRNSIFNKQWFWTNLNAVTAQQGSSYAGNNYATYVSGVGGVGPTYISTSVEVTSLRPLAFTKVGQGFIVQAKYNNAPLQFNNGIRSSNTSDSIFFNKNQSENEEDEPETLNRYWLKLISPQNVGNTILLAYNNSATNGYDEDYDAELMSVGNDSFYSSVDNHKLQIQARANPFSKNDVVDLGIKCSVAGNHTIAIDGKDGIFGESSNHAIYIKDASTNSLHNLQDGPYTFFANAEEDNTRFKIIYENSVLATENKLKDQLLVYKKNSSLIIKDNDDIQKVEIYDASGKLVFAKDYNSKEIDINNYFSKGFHIVKVIQKSGVKTKKIIL